MCSTEANVRTCWHYIKLFVELTLAFLISFALCKDLTCFHSNLLLPLSEIFFNN